MSEFSGLAAEIWPILSSSYDPAKIVAALRQVEALEAERDALRQTLVEMTGRIERVNREIEEGEA